MQCNISEHANGMKNMMMKIQNTQFIYILIYNKKKYVESMLAILNYNVQYILSIYE